MRLLSHSNGRRGFDSPGEDDEADIGSESHETASIDDSNSSDAEDVAVGELNLDHQSSASALANHGPRVSGPVRRTEVGRALYQFHGYFERQEAAKCGMHALNNAIGFMFCTERDLARACEANLRDHAFDLRDMHVAPTGWYSSEVMATALLITGSGGVHSSG